MAHILVLDSNEDMFVCGPCKSVFNSLEIFLSHKKINCGKEFVDKTLENAFVSTEIPTKNLATMTEKFASVGENCVVRSVNASNTDETVKATFSCQICGKTMKTRKSLSVHLKSHCIKSYQCLVCGRCFIQKSHLERHVPSHKVWPESLSDTTAKSADSELLGYSCPYCVDTFSNYNQFRTHLKVHQNLKVYKCIQGGCSSLFESFENLLKHVSSTHIEPMYTCYMCQESFSSLKNIYNHQQSHSNYVKDSKPSKKYKCLQCDAMYNTPEKLSLHVQTEDHQKKCIHCNRNFSSNKRLRLHLQVHRKIKPFQCHICCSSFHMKKYLTSHMLRHAKRNFVCFICKSMFKRQDLLQRHIRLHQVNKMFKCPYKETLNCLKEFSRSDKLKLHMKSHSDHMYPVSNAKEHKSEELPDVEEKG